jgi:hypothetical protein
MIRKINSDQHPLLTNENRCAIENREIDSRNFSNTEYFGPSRWMNGKMMEKNLNSLLFKKL